MPKLKIYLDTSILNFYYADDSPERMKITRELFKEIKEDNHDAFISDVVKDEISKAKSKKREELLNLIANYKFETLKNTEETQKLAEEYINRKIIPKSYFGDALHIAIAVISKVDVLVSWNFKHIVKVSVVKAVNEINKTRGKKEILIYSPMEVVE